MITLRDVQYTYPEREQPALQGIDLDIAPGTLCAITGPNGAGKSTLCYALAGFVPHSFSGELRGDVVVAGRNTREHPLAELVQHCGMVFSNPLNQLSGARWTVREEVAFGLENLGVPRSEMIRRVDAVLDLFGIGDLGDRSPWILSGGQQQRTALASIVVMGPQVLVLDEPAAQLDPQGSHEVVAAIAALRRTGVTVVLVEHKPELLVYADRVVVLHNGQVVRDGSPQDVLTDPLLPTIGVHTTRYTDAARRGREHGVWPTDLPLPVTLDQAEHGFRTTLNEQKTS
jgi:energy-coupling factor transporter ATP-binding protein EcfA2